MHDGVNMNYAISVLYLKKFFIENWYIHYYIHNNIVLVNSIHFKPCLFLSIKKKKKKKV